MWGHWVWGTRAATQKVNLCTFHPTTQYPHDDDPHDGGDRQSDGQKTCTHAKHTKKAYTHKEGATSQ